MDTMSAPYAMTSDTGDPHARQAAFTAKLEQHRGIVLKIAYSYCRDTDDQRDLVQDISLQLWRAFPEFDPERSRFSTWMYRIALNVAISQLRSSSRRRRHHLDVDDHAIAAVPDQAAASPEDTLALHTLQALIRRLDPLNRALMLLYLDDRSHRDIAEILGITPGNVATKIGRLKQRIREQIA